MTYIHDIFGGEGKLAGLLEGYSPRPGQIEYAERVDGALSHGTHLMIEGATGIGKSLGYLVPLIHHSLKRECAKTALVVTANIALQEQLVTKDLPLLRKVLDREFTFGILKGRHNYLCLMRLDEINMSGDSAHKGAADDGHVEKFEAIMSWATMTETGDVSELPFTPDYRLWHRFSVNADECAASACPYAGECHSEQVRRHASTVNVLVTNYHILFAHLKVLEETDKCLVLPKAFAMVLDEGHKAADIARDFYGFKVSHGSTVHISRRLRPVVGTKLVDGLEAASAKFYGDLYSYSRSDGYKVRLREPEPVPSTELLARLQAVEDAVEDVLHSDRVENKASRAEIAMVARFVARTRQNLHTAMRLADPNQVYSIEADEDGRKVSLRARMIDVSGYLAANLYKHASVIATSATLSIDGSFAFQAKDLGLAEYDSVSIPSPFQWRDRVLLVLPPMVEPRSPDYQREVADSVVEVVKQTGGRTLALFTSYVNMGMAYDRLIDSGFPGRVKKQGDLSRTALIEQFRDKAISVLLGTESFWGGVDIPGDACVCVVMDRLPFPSPMDPVHDAIVERDREWFMNYSLPRAILQFRQGFGRLMRRVDDYGVVVVLDSRLTGKPYGKRFLNSIPPVRKSRDIEVIGEFLAEVGGAS